MRDTPQIKIYTLFLKQGCNKRKKLASEIKNLHSIVNQRHLDEE
jgi:hypothetical protein